MLELPPLLMIPVLWDSHLHCSSQVFRLIFSALIPDLKVTIQELKVLDLSSPGFFWARESQAVYVTLNVTARRGTHTSSGNADFYQSVFYQLGMKSLEFFLMGVPGVLQNAQLGWSGMEPWNSRGVWLGGTLNRELPTEKPPSTPRLHGVWVLPIK